MWYCAIHILLLDSRVKIQFLLVIEIEENNSYNKTYFNKAMEGYKQHERHTTHLQIHETAYRPP